MDKRLFSYINWGLLACMLLLYFLGVGNLYSASGTRLGDGLAFSGFYQRQLIWGVCGLACMLLAMSFDYRQLRNLAWPFFLITLVLLLLVPVAGKTVYGAKRWLSLGFMSIQPSELAKLAVLVLAARLLARDGRPLGWKDFMAVLAVGLIPSALIITQPDLGTTLMILLILGGMILFHGLKGYVLKTCLLAAPCAAAFMWFVGMHDYQRQRILTFLDPGNDPRGTGYHILQSRIAIGSGQLSAGAPFGLRRGRVRRGMGFRGLRGPGHPVLPLPALHLFHGGTGQGPLRQYAGGGGLLLFLLANFHQYGHGHRTDAGGGHSSALHQLRRQRHSGQLHPAGHCAQCLHAALHVQRISNNGEMGGTRGQG